MSYVVFTVLIYAIAWAVYRIFKDDSWRDNDLN